MPSMKRVQAELESHCRIAVEEVLVGTAADDLGGVGGDGSPGECPHLFHLRSGTARRRCGRVRNTAGHTPRVGRARVRDRILAPACTKCSRTLLLVIREAKVALTNSAPSRCASRADRSLCASSEYASCHVSASTGASRSSRILSTTAPSKVCLFGKCQYRAPGWTPSEVASLRIVRSASPNSSSIAMAPSSTSPRRNCTLSFPSFRPAVERSRSNVDRDPPLTVFHRVSNVNTVQLVRCSILLVSKEDVCDPAPD